MALWMPAADGSVVIPTKREPARVVAGAVLTLIGSAIGWQLVRAISVNRATTHAPWTEYIPVMLVFGGIAMAFVIPGALMLLYTRSVRLDSGRQEVADSRVYLGYRHTRSYPLSGFTTIVLTRRFFRGRKRSSIGTSRTGRSYPMFIVEMARATGQPLKVLTDQREAPAREIADKLVFTTSLAFRDDVERERQRERSGLDHDDDQANEDAAENDEQDEDS